MGKLNLVARGAFGAIEAIAQRWIGNRSKRTCQETVEMLYTQAKCFGVLKEVYNELEDDLGCHACAVASTLSIFPMCVVGKAYWYRTEMRNFTDTADYHLPTELFDRLEGGTRYEDGGYNVMYDSATDALIAVVNAVKAFGQEVIKEKAIKPQAVNAAASDESFDLSDK